MDRLAIAMIVAANVLTLGIAWMQHWPLLLLLIPYWVQSVVIGWYSARRMLALERFTGLGGSNSERVKRETVEFFAMHYGGFHAGYLCFLVVFALSGILPGIDALVEPGGSDLAWLAATSLLFVLTHRTSFRRNLEHDRKGRPDIGTLMFLPYARVVPMHVAILIGVNMSYSGGVLLFGALKTAADVLMHYVEHTVLASGK